MGGVPATKTHARTGLKYHVYLLRCNRPRGSGAKVLAQALQILYDLGVKRNARFRAFLERLELLFSGDVDAIAAGGRRGRFDVPQNAVHVALEL